MGTDSCLWGWWALFAAFNLALVHLLGAPQLNSEGLHVSWYVSLWSWSGSWRGRHSGPVYRIGSFRSCGPLRGQLGEGGTGAWMGSFHGGLRGEKVETWGDSPQESIEAFHLWSHNSLPEFSPPLCFHLLSLSFQFSSLLPFLTHVVKQSQPLKKKEEIANNNQMPGLWGKIW